MKPATLAPCGGTGVIVGSCSTCKSNQCLRLHTGGLDYTQACTTRVARKYQNTDQNDKEFVCLELLLVFSKNAHLQHGFYKLRLVDEGVSVTLDIVYDIVAMPLFIRDWVQIVP